MELQIDHVTVCGRDLDGMRAGFQAVGIETEYGGPHANGLTHMALAGFEDGSYLELIAPLEGADPSRATGMMAGWMPLMTGNAGAGAWAVRAEGIEKVVDELRARRVEVRGPEPGGRKRPDGKELRWKIAVAGPGAAGSVLPFMIEDGTERSWRVQPAGNSLGVGGVAAVMIGVRDLAEASKRFHTAYDWDAPEKQELASWEAQTASFRDTPVILATGASQSSWLAGRVRQFGDGPAAFLLKQSGAASIPEIDLDRKVSWLDAAKLGGTRIGIVSA
jgi:hypothetical protein